MGLLDLEILPSTAKLVPPLTQDNATNRFSLYALTEAQNGNLLPLAMLATMDDESEEGLKAVALFKEAASSEKKHWLAEAIYKIADSYKFEDQFMLMEVLRSCPIFHYKILRRALQQGFDIAKELIRSHERIDHIATEAYSKRADMEQAWKRGSAKVNQPYNAARAFCIQTAQEWWNKQPDYPIREVCPSCL